MVLGPAKRLSILRQRWLTIYRRDLGLVGLKPVHDTASAFQGCIHLIGAAQGMVSYECFAVR